MKIFLCHIISSLFLHIAVLAQDIYVAPDGSAEFKTVQAAINAVHSGDEKRRTIHLAAGTYREVVHIDSSKRNIRLLGAGPEKTQIVFGNHTGTVLENGDTVNTMTSATVFIYANNLELENIGFRNDAGFSAGQAVAVRVHADSLAFRNCHFTGNQDVLFLSAANTRQYFKDCYLEGTTDFIFGAATALFDGCHIHSRKNSHITAASTPAALAYGFVFRNCKLTADKDITKVTLGRPWRPYASVTYLNCRMDDHIIPEGWDNWRNEANEQTARFAEYQSSGPGARVANRAAWAKQLTEKEAAAYTLPLILNNWIPFND